MWFLRKKGKNPDRSHLRTVGILGLNKLHYLKAIQKTLDILPSELRFLVCGAVCVLAFGLDCPRRGLASPSILHFVG